MKYKGLFFDFDYTLGDATEAIVAGFVYGLYSMGYPLPEREAIRRTVGLVLRDAFTELTGEASPEKREEFAEHYHLCSVPMQPKAAVLCQGAEELLRDMKAQGAKLAVVSSKPTPVLKAVLEEKGVLDCFAEVVGADRVRRAKPDPEGILATAEKLGLKREEILYCGDTVIDAEAGMRAGVDLCPVLNGTTPAEDFENYPHVFLAQELPQLHRWLKEETK